MFPNTALFPKINISNWNKILILNDRLSKKVWLKWLWSIKNFEHCAYLYFRSKVVVPANAVAENGRPETKTNIWTRTTKKLTNWQRGQSRRRTKTTGHPRRLLARGARRARPGRAPSGGERTPRPKMKFSQLFLPRLWINCIWRKIWL